MAYRNENQREKLQQLTDKLQDGVRQVFESERYAEYLRVMSRFHRYSYRNSLLIAMQNPNATMVASYGKWQELGRQVQRGEKAIQILAPTPYKTKKEMDVMDQETQMPVLNPDGSVMTEEVEITIPAFRVANVFDVAQTEGRALPTLFDNLEGDVNGFRNFMKAMESVAPVPIGYEPMDDKDGYYDQVKKQIFLRSDMSERQTVAAVIHETSHAKLHDIDVNHLRESLQARGKDQQIIEVEAESIAYMVSQYYGIETGENSFGYIAMWSKNKELPELMASLEIICDTAAELIDQLDERMEELRREQELLHAVENSFGIYQIRRDIPEAKDYSFMSMSYLEEHGITPLREHYSLVYTGRLENEVTLEDLFEQFNVNRPEDFTGHSLSVSDIVVLQQDAVVTAYYVDSFGFEELEGFLEIEPKTQVTELAYQVGEEYFAIHETDGGYDYTFYDAQYIDLDGGIIEGRDLTIKKAADTLIDAEGLADQERIPMDYDGLTMKAEQAGQALIQAAQVSQGEAYKPLAKVEELEEANYNMIDNVINNQPAKIETNGRESVKLEYYAAVCDEFHDMAACYTGDNLEEIAEKYREIRNDPSLGYMGNGFGIVWHDTENDLYDGIDVSLIHGTRIEGDVLDHTKFLASEPMIYGLVERLHELFPEYEYTPPKDIREALYPKVMTTERLALALVELAKDFDFYDYTDNVDSPLAEQTAMEDIVMQLRLGNKAEYLSNLKDVIEDGSSDCALRAEVLSERIKAYVPDLPKEFKPQAKILFCDEKLLPQGMYWEIEDLDKQVASLDQKYAAVNASDSEELDTVYRVSVQICYPWNGRLETLTTSIDIGEGDGGLISSIKAANERKLSDTDWLNYLKGKGEEAYQSAVADMTDMQEKILPYLQSFCSVEERVPEKTAVSEQKAASTAKDAKVQSTVQKDVPKGAPKQGTLSKEKKSLHERLEIKKKLVAQKQGKDCIKKGVELA